MQSAKKELPPEKLKMIENFREKYPSLAEPDIYFTLKKFDFNQTIAEAHFLLVLPKEDDDVQGEWISVKTRKEKKDMEKAWEQQKEKAERIMENFRHIEENFTDDRYDPFKQDPFFREEQRNRKRGQYQQKEKFYEKSRQTNDTREDNNHNERQGDDRNDHRENQYEGRGEERNQRPVNKRGPRVKEHVMFVPKPPEQSKPATEAKETTPEPPKVEEKVQIEKISATPTATPEAHHHQTPKVQVDLQPAQTKPQNEPVARPTTTTSTTQQTVAPIQPPAKPAAEVKSAEAPKTTEAPSRPQGYSNTMRVHYEPKQQQARPQTNAEEQHPREEAPRSRVEEPARVPVNQGVSTRNAVEQHTQNIPKTTHHPVSEGQRLVQPPISQHHHHSPAHQPNHHHHHQGRYDSEVQTNFPPQQQQQVPPQSQHHPHQGPPQTSFVPIFMPTYDPATNTTYVPVPIQVFGDGTFSVMPNQMPMLIPRQVGEGAPGILPAAFPNRFAVGPTYTPAQDQSDSRIHASAGLPPSHSAPELDSRSGQIGGKQDKNISTQTTTLPSFLNFGQQFLNPTPLSFPFVQPPQQQPPYNYEQLQRQQASQYSTGFGTIGPHQSTGKK
eukprot:TRINITY_DN3678_c0_g1_i3.p1 TRINITY_DN3678_c0_g1~~TRINITY_DN3678_c0_g1_i3.p1  ORF type:complete len:610 (+),score=184.76 TRINITY_DN3678_c0_g1_i3:202-2031(+)